MEKGKFAGVETLKEKVKVKFVDGEGNLFKKYDIKDIKIIKDVEKEDDNLEIEDPEDLKELQELEKFEKLESEGGEEDGI